MEKLRTPGGQVRNACLLGIALFLSVCHPAEAALRCYDCHGTRSSEDYRPVDSAYRNLSTGGFQGNHRTHLPAIVRNATACSTCHPGSDSYNSGHMDKKISVQIRSDHALGEAAYRGTTSAFLRTATPALGTCTNVNCHFNNQTPAWGAAPYSSLADCDKCHDTPPSSGNHPGTEGVGAKHGAYYGTDTGSCKRCHPDHMTEMYPFAHATSAGKRSLNVGFSGGGGFSGDLSYPSFMTAGTTAGTCTVPTCHSDGKGGAPNATPAWGETLPGDCTGCHGGNTESTRPVDSGNHGKHIAGYRCGKCHGTTVSSTDDRTVSVRLRHVDGNVGVEFDQGSYAKATKTCAVPACHFEVSPVWGGASAADCTSCHGGDTASSRVITSGTHTAHLDNDTTLGQGNGFGCVECHASTVSGNRIVSNKLNHANQLKNYSGGRAGRIATAGSGSCTSNYCHSTGMVTNQYWDMTSANWYSGSTLSCNGCHGSIRLPDGSVAESASVAGEPVYFNITSIGQRNSHRKHVEKSGVTETTGCAKCHRTTVDAATAGKLRDYSSAHLNRSVDVAFSPLGNFTGNYAKADKSCSNTYCHAGSRASWGGASLRCFDCHKADATLPGAHGKHWQQGNPDDYVASPQNTGTATGYQFQCSSCHRGAHANGPAADGNGNTAEVFFGYTSPGMSGTYSYGATSTSDGTFRWSDGRCSNVYCHSDGNNGPGNSAAYTWGSPEGTLGCAGCHGNSSASGSPITTNAHGKHVDNAGVIGTNYGCRECHAKTVSSDNAIADKRLHANKMKDYSGARAGGSATYAGKSCSASYCHSSGKKGAPGVTEPTPPVWTGGQLGCDGCHGVGTGTGYPAYPSSAAGTVSANNHPKHVAGAIARGVACPECHAATLKADNTIRNDIIPSNHTDRHIDVLLNVSGSPAASYTPAGKSCASVYCHSNGAPFDKSNRYMENLAWGGAAMTCGSCHDGGGVSTQLSGRHGVHTDGGKYAFSCERCHSLTASENAIGSKTAHVNQVKDVSFKEGGTYGTDRECSNSYCHGNGAGGPPTVRVTWSDTDKTMQCFSCHKGRAVDNAYANCSSVGGSWVGGLCVPFLNMTSNGHMKLVGPQWIRKYPCTYCHTNTVTAVTDVMEKITDGTINYANHLNGQKDIAFPSKWKILGRPDPTYNKTEKTCDNIYCHSDGTTNPEQVKRFKWSDRNAACNSCHGHPLGSCANANCHDDQPNSTGQLRSLQAIYLNVTASTPSNKYRWPAGQTWKSALPMFPNLGPGTGRENSHTRHMETNFSCDNCHYTTMAPNSNCTTAGCHTGTGTMTEAAHLNGEIHVNKIKDVVFKYGGTYDKVTKSCSNLGGGSCHVSGGGDPKWGSSSSNVVCYSCHGTGNLKDVDSFGFVLYSTQAKINMTEWTTTGHGRPSAAGPYPGSGNPAANFPGNPCWYCHDNTILHNDPQNPFRLRQHQQYSTRFQKECVYCHMTGTNAECLGCHSSATGSTLAPQLAAIFGSISASWPDGTPVTRPDHSTMTDGRTSCTTSLCHYVNPATPTKDIRLHNAGAGLWTVQQQEDVKNQYVMMGVCLKCHDDDSSGKCTSCHTPPADNPLKYSIGFKAYSGYPLIRPAKARATSAHFGYKHYRDFLQGGGWRGGKFCWDCHDPHGDSNIYMVHEQVATETDGRFGIPKKRSKVVFTQKKFGSDYTTKDSLTGVYTGICNVCHSPGSKHYTSTSADTHNKSKICTTCHEHRFSDSHADKQSCNSCHKSKPVPRHEAFGLPRDCTKCHTGVLGKRMDIMGQFAGTSHHVQGVTVTNRHCYPCHWEATAEGVIDPKYHEGYNYKTYTSVKNAKVDLVIWKPGVRPVYYNSTTAAQFTAEKMGTAEERAEVSKITNTCIGCHSDRNNDTKPFGDCKTPRQYAWDFMSVDARYRPKGTTTTAWSGYNTTGKATVTKAFSAHGNATGNQGGWNTTSGLDANITDTRNGTKNVECFDCHSSHGSKIVGTTSSYVTFNGTRNGGNLKETVAGTGGYSINYTAKPNTTGINPYNAGAGQCFDCHFSPTATTTPWGYQSTFGASSPIKGYFDTDKFSTGIPAYMTRYPYKTKSMKGGHFKPSSFLNNTTAAGNKINGLCTPCHDPHGVSPSFGSAQKYAVPMLKGTWMTSPYPEDATDMTPVTGIKGGTKSQGPQTRSTPTSLYTDQATFGYGGGVSETADQFGGLCIRCHAKGKLTDGINRNGSWKSLDRIHESVKGWGSNTMHKFTCSKCHVPHVSALPRLMITNCMDYKHKLGRSSGGVPGAYFFNGSRGNGYGGFPKGGTGGFGYDENGWSIDRAHFYNATDLTRYLQCHPGTWPDNSWNYRTQW